MIVIAAAVFGALYGARQAKSRGGKGLDLAQYAAGYGIAFALLGLVATLLIDRLI